MHVKCIKHLCTINKRNNRWLTERERERERGVVCDDNTCAHVLCVRACAGQRRKE